MVFSEEEFFGPPEPEIPLQTKMAQAMTASLLWREGFTLTSAIFVPRGILGSVALIENKVPSRRTATWAT